MRAAFLVAAAIAAVAPFATACTGGNSFDFIALVQQYPPVVCTPSSPVNCNGTDAYGTLHGFWPSIASDGPCDCTDEKFDESIVEPFISEMNKWWPSYDGPNADFWKHEYEKHGTCAESIPQLSTQLGFFKTTLSLVQKYNFVPLLAQGGIVPSDSNSVSVSHAKSVLVNSFGGSPSFSCDDSGNLNAVALCFDKSLQPTDCSGMEGSCGSSFSYPASSGGSSSSGGAQQ